MRNEGKDAFLVVICILKCLSNIVLIIIRFSFHHDDYLAAKTVVKYSVNKKKEIKINMKIEREEGRDEFIILFL